MRRNRFEVIFLISLIGLAGCMKKEENKLLRQTPISEQRIFLPVTQEKGTGSVFSQVFNLPEDWDLFWRERGEAAPYSLNPGQSIVLISGKKTQHKELWRLKGGLRVVLEMRPEDQLGNQSVSSVKEPEKDSWQSFVYEGTVVQVIHP